MSEVFVPLLDDGLPVWRPVPASDVGGGIFVIAPDATAPDDERWAFNPGDRVRCEFRALSGGGPVLVAVERVGSVAPAV